MARPASRPTHVVVLLSRRYDPFVWPVPKGCPAGDPTVAAPVARGTRPPGDYERETASIARGEEMSHSGTNNGAPSQCRAAAQSTARARDRQEGARNALALAEGNNPIEEGKYYIVCFELNEEPDELFFTLMLATNVSVFPCFAIIVCLGARITEPSLVSFIFSRAKIAPSIVTVFSRAVRFYVVLQRTLLLTPRLAALLPTIVLRVSRPRAHLPVRSPSSAHRAPARCSRWRTSCTLPRGVT